METIQRDIAGGFIFSADNKLLLIQNDSETGAYAGIWTVPGGGIDPTDKSAQDAMVREVREELGLDVSQETITLANDQGSGTSDKTIDGVRYRVEMRFYDFLVRLAVNATAVTLELSPEIEAARWFAPAELATVRVGPGTIGTLKKLGIIQSS